MANPKRYIHRMRSHGGGFQTLISSKDIDESLLESELWDELNLEMHDPDFIEACGNPEWVDWSDLKVTELRRLLRVQFPSSDPIPSGWQGGQVRAYVLALLEATSDVDADFATEYGITKTQGWTIHIDSSGNHGGYMNDPDPPPTSTPSAPPTSTSGGDNMMEMFMSGILDHVRAESVSMVEAHVTEALSDVITGSQFKVLAKELRDEIDVGKKVVVQNPQLPDPVTLEGTHPQFEWCLRSCASRMNLFLVGGAGTGKTYMTKQIAKALGITHYMLSCTADMMRHDLFGFIDAGGNYHSTPLRRAWEWGGLFVIDEVDLATANLMGGVNDVANVDSEDLEFPDGRIDRHPEFRLIACANTIGEGATSTYRGRNALDGAFLDRFVFMDIELDEAIETRRVLALMSDETRAVSWLAIVRRVRQNIKQYALPMIVTPRAAMHGAQLLELGMGVTSVVTSTPTRGCTSDVYRKMMDGVEVKV